MPQGIKGMKKNFTLSDVAEAAGVDASTVSRVLNRDPRLRAGESTKQRVIAAAERLGYRPNALARGLRTARTSTLAFVIPQIENPVFAQVFVGALEAANARGYDLVMTLVDNFARAGGVYERLAHASRVDGLLVATSEPDDVLLKELKRASVPYVVVNRRLRGVENCIAFENVGAARKATEYLISLGHRRIAHLAGTAEDWNSEGRVTGYRAALEEAGIRYESPLLVRGGYTFAGGVKGMRTLLKMSNRPTAVLTATTLTAAGALSALSSAGIDVPGEMSVMGIHETQMAEMLLPPLTTVGLPLRRMGETAANGLIDILQGKAVTVGCLLDSYEMHFRASTAPVAAGEGGGT